MRREKLEHLVTTGMVERKRSRGKRREKMFDRLTKWLKVGRMTEAVKATRDRDAGKVMIAYAKDHGISDCSPLNSGFKLRWSKTCRSDNIVKIKQP